MGVPWEERMNEVASIATSAGSWSGNTTLLIGHVSGVRVRAATSSTRFDLAMVDRDNFTVYQRRGIKGAIVEDLNIPIPVRSILTVTISNATANEGFTVKLMVEQ